MVFGFNLSMTNRNNYSEFMGIYPSTEWKSVCHYRFLSLPCNMESNVFGLIFFYFADLEPFLKNNCES